MTAALAGMPATFTLEMRRALASATHVLQAEAACEAAVESAVAAELRAV